MARYYEETALIEFVDNNTPTVGSATTIECVMRAIRHAPTADVVSKSENDLFKAEVEKLTVMVKLLEQDVADWQQIAESKVEEVYPEFMRDYKCMREELDGLYDEFHEARAEIKYLADILKTERKCVADDISDAIEEEIELALESNCKVKRDAQGDNDGLVIYVDGKIDCLRGLKDFVDELKKKYTGDCE